MYNNNFYQPYGASSPGYTNVQYQQPIHGTFFVNGDNGANMFQLPPNSDVPLFDMDNLICYYKYTDAAGYPTLQKYRMEPIPEKEQVAQELNTDIYATKEDIKSLTDDISQIKELLLNAESNVSTSRSTTSKQQPNSKSGGSN